MFSNILRNTLSVDAKMYSKMPTEIFLGSLDCLLLWELSVAMETSSDLIWPKPFYSLSPNPMMLQVKFGCDWPTGFRDIHV